jgi:hypothetical protein
MAILCFKKRPAKLANKYRLLLENFKVVGVSGAMAEAQPHRTICEQEYTHALRNCSQFLDICGSKKKLSCIQNTITV